MLWLWLGLSLLSLAAMYHLWWSRERALYAGKSAQEQREVVFERAGIPAQTLELAKQADAAWPQGVSYDADGSEVSLSYFKYLVLPRIPSGSEEYRIQEKDGTCALAPAEEAPPAQRLFQAVDPTPRGLILSALVVLAIAAGLMRFGFSLPEGAACAVLLLCAASVLLKPLFHSYRPIGMLMCVLGGLGAWLAWVSRKERTQVLPEEDAGRGIGDKRMRWAALMVLGGAWMWALLMAIVVVPDDWDAWAIWGPKAKVLLLGSGPLSDVTHFGHPDYPLLWPSVWAFSGWCAGGWEEQWGKGWSVLFLALTAWQMGRLSRDFTGRREAGWLVPAIFVSMPAVPLVASWAYAEAPLWLALACAYGRLMRWHDRHQISDAIWAGVFAGAAAWTKNEGALLFVLGLIGLGLSRNSKKWQAAGAYLAIFAVLYVPWLCWIKQGAELEPGVSLGIRLSALRLIADRLPEAIQLVGRMWLDVRQWNVVLVCALGLTVLLAARRLRAFSRFALIPIGMGVGSLAVIVLREGELVWQIGTAWNRLTIQFFVLLLPALAAGMGRCLNGESACPKRPLEQE